MPLEDGLLIACRNDVVELTASVFDARHEHPDAFREALEERMLEHRRLSMTDPALVDSDSLGVASIVLSRDPLPEAVQEILASLGFTAEETESGGRDRGGLFSFWSRGRRSKLDRWRLPYARARDVSPALEVFEQACVDSVMEPPIWDLNEASEALRSSCHKAYGFEPEETLEGLSHVESALAFKASDRLVLHSAAIRGLTAFVITILEGLISGLRYDPEAELPILIPTQSGPPIGSDPEFRVVEHVRIGARASLGRYVRQLESDHRTLP